MIEHYKRLVSLVLGMHAEQATEDGTYDPQGDELAAILLAHQIRDMENRQIALNQKESAPNDVMAFLELKSPIEITGEPKNCVELTIYDNDGPEGYYNRLRFLKSSQAVDCIRKYFSKNGATDPDLNFEIVNHWKQTP